MTDKDDLRARSPINNVDKAVGGIMEKVAGIGDPEGNPIELWEPQGKCP